MATVFLNGRFIARDEALVSAFDAGFQHGVGLFETMLAVRGAEGLRVLHLSAHVERLARSARAMGLSESLRVGALEEAVKRTVERAGAEIDAERLRLRLTVTGGDLNMLGRGEGPAGEGTVLIVAQPATAYPAEMFERGVGVVIADWKANPLDPMQGHKTLNYWARLRELQVAAAKRAGEALVFQVTNHLAGGCVSNAFVVKGGVLYTPIARGEEEGVGEDGDENAEPPRSGGPPMLPSPVLPGVVRRWVMDWAESEGVAVQRRMLTISDVLEADEVLLTNSSWGVLPVVKVEREAIGDGVVGPMGKRLVEEWGSCCGGS